MKIPEKLRALNQWVLWRNEEKADGDKTKVPINARTGWGAKSTDKETWSTFETALTSRISCDGIGFVFSPDDPYCGIDLDGCRNPESGMVADWAKKIILRFNTYTEVSPSKTGVKLWLIGTKNNKGCKAEMKHERVSDKAPAVEVYDQGRYFTMTGLKLKGMPDEPQTRQAELDEFMETMFPPLPPITVMDRARLYMQKVPPAISGEGGDKQTFRMACILVLGFGLDRGEAIQLLREYNQVCVPPWEDRELLRKIDYANKQTGERNYLRGVEQSDWDKIKIPEYRQPQDKPAKDVRKTTLLGGSLTYIEKRRRGEEYLIELGLPEVDKMLGGGVAPGEVVLLGARPSHGKSAAALQALHHWTLNQIPSLIVSEEMSSLLLGKRALQFISDIPQEQWDGELDALEGQLNDYAEARVDCHIVESCGDVQTVVEQIEIHVRDHGVQCVVVDYAQRLKGQGKGRYEQVTEVSIALTACAKRLGIVLVVLVQLGRDIEKRKPFVPVASDIKESGQFEQDADVIIFQVWPWKLDAREPKEKYQFFCLKNRNREIQSRGFVECRFLGNRQKFVSDKKFLADAMQHDFTPEEKVDDDFHEFN